jgi:hypothetical protein
MKLFTSVLLAAATWTIIAMGSECKGTQSIAAGILCFEVPCDYEVVQTDSWRDAWSGYIEPPDHSWRVTWYVGLYEKLLKPKNGRRVVFQRDEQFNGEQWTTGLIEEDKGRSLVLSDGAIQFVVPQETVDASQVLKRIAAMRKFRKAGVQCSPPKHLNNK